MLRLAAICHDTGHPPFAHKGERALATLMSTSGGFEGNAQTLHLLSKVAKLVKGGKAHYGISRGKDQRYGLNLTARALGALLKYDNCIPAEAGTKPVKGYYAEEGPVVDWRLKVFSRLQRPSQNRDDSGYMSQVSHDSPIELEVRRIRELSRAGQHVEALAAAQALVSEASDTRDVTYLIAANQRCLKRIPEALETLQRVEQQDPTFSLLYPERGYRYTTQRDAPRAIEAFLEAVKLNPALVESWRMLERLYRVTGHATNAATELTPVPYGLIGGMENAISSSVVL